MRRILDPLWRLRDDSNSDNSNSQKYLRDHISYKNVFLKKLKVRL